jgi:hypothetical protein
MSVGHVVILGLGPSLETYFDMVKRLGGRHAFCDQVWAVNALGDLAKCDLIFHMDDVRIQEIRAAARPKSNIARMLEWMRKTDIPIMTSFAHPDYPATVELPLEDMINTLGFSYFNGTVAHAAAYAIYLGATKISFFGCDYTLPNSHHAEQGRACLEFWLGYAAARGISLGTSEKSSLLDSCEAPPAGTIKCYGYDAVTIRTADVEGPDGTSIKLTFEPLETLPTAEEIERRYDHGAHPNALMRGEPAKPKT